MAMASRKWRRHQALDVATVFGAKKLDVARWLKTGAVSEPEPLRLPQTPSMEAAMLAAIEERKLLTGA